MTRPYVEARQLAARRAEMHAAVDGVCDAAPSMAASAKAGRRSAPGGRRGPGSHADPTAAAALAGGPAADWLVSFDAVAAALFALADAAAAATSRAGPAAAAAASAPTVCEFCGTSGGRFSRIDGAAFHAKPDACYYRRWRAGAARGPE